jgi:hypothetical protein
MSVARLSLWSSRHATVSDFDIDDRWSNLLGRIDDRLRVRVKQRGIVRRRR